MKEMRSIDANLFALSSLNNYRIDIGSLCTFNIPLSQKTQVGQAEESPRRDQSDLIVNQLPATMQIICSRNRWDSSVTHEQMTLVSPVKVPSAMEVMRLWFNDLRQASLVVLHT